MNQLDIINQGRAENEKITLEQLKAAYALNMCTVSVSQIVDYNDKYILDQEYDAILNNLNLEEMPEDDALLKILVELLNTITFFRIQEIKKQQIEKKYQEQMKNAIWNAIPNIGVIVTSGSPIAIGAALATQVGASYMNYRKAKAQAESGKADAEIELQITAIEQFNALKRELFTTAWRLTKNFGFADCLRLTEKQISQYNDILMDSDEYRMYSRLEAIQDKFQAYPPFWYYFGHTALAIADMSDDEENRQKYIEKAKSHFSHYEMMNEFSILREDHLTSAFALEFIDLLLLEETPDFKRIENLLKTAIANAGNEFDVLQLCAISGLKIGKREIAKGILKILVNEDYNRTVNAQLLSGIYVQERDYSEYEILAKRVNPKYLFPMPSRENTDVGLLNEEFERNQRDILKEKFKLTLVAAQALYSEKMNKKISVFDLNESYEDGFFASDERGRRLRHSKAERVLNDNEKREYYLDRLRTINIPVIYTELIDDMMQNVLSINIFKNSELRTKVIDSTIQTIQDYKDVINDCQGKTHGNFSIREYDVLQSISVGMLTRDAWDVLYRKACEVIDTTTGTDLMVLDGNLFSLCNKLNIDVPEIATGNTLLKGEKEEIPHLSVNIFGSEAYVAQKDSNYIGTMSKFIKEALSKIRVSEKVQIVYRDIADSQFDNYFINGVFDDYPTLYSNSMAVLKHFNDKYDFIFCRDGIVYMYKGKVGKKVPYEKIKLENDKLNLWGKNVKSTDVDLNGLIGVINGIKGRFILDNNNNREYVGKVAEVKHLNEWFRDASCGSMEGTEKVYAVPRQDILDSLGVMIEESNWSNCLLQFIYDMNNRLVLEYRIVEFETLSPKFKEQLKLANGVIRLE